MAGTPATPLDLENNLFDFFREHLDTAVQRQGNPVSEDGVYYLANLLVERGRVHEHAEATTLAELHAEARASDRVRAISVYRELGDRTLYVTGFFRASLARRPVGVQYYMDMGAAAYDRLARILAGPSSSEPGIEVVFEELSDGFATCSEVLQDVRDELRSQVRGEVDIVRLYEEWIATGSPRIADRLRELGLIPLRERPGPSGDGD